MIDITIIGQTLIDDRYEILEPIGEGGQAVVAKALDQQTGNEVVIKQLSASPSDSGYDEAVARFKRAGKIRANHPNVVDPIDYAEENGEHYIIMPYAEGDTLAQHLTKNGGKLPCDEACRIPCEIAKGLAAIHPSIVHRDLKPENIIIGNDGHVYIVDFGVCRKPTEKTITTGEGLLGTLVWMSPEQVKDPTKVDHRSDLYSLGAMHYAMLTTSQPVRGKDAGEIAASILNYIPPSPRQIDPSIPAHIDQACMRLLEKDPDRRFQKAEDFIAALNGTAPAITAGRFCTGCGTQTQPGFRFCHNCGNNLSAVQNKPARCLACGRPAGQETLCTTCGRPFGNSGHHLCFTTGSLTGMTFRVPEGIFSIGRNELSPKDFHISRRHFFVACTNGSVCVQDAGSANKTFVGGKLAELPTPLQPGQQICVAGNTATYNHN